MKKSTLVLAILVLVLPFVLMACAVPAAGGVASTGSVSEGQMYIVGVFASAIVYGLKLLAKYYPKLVIKRAWLTIGIYVIALGLSVIWGGMTIPTFAVFNDPVTFVASVFGWVTALLIALAPSVSFATLIYNLLLKRIFDSWATPSAA